MDNYLAALLLAYGFTALGAAVLRRDPRTWYEFNQFFLTGLTAATLLIFVLSLLIGRYALFVILILLVAVSALALRKRVLPQLRLPQIPRAAIVPVLLTAAASLVFLSLNARVTFHWDGFQIWATKALLLYERGALTDYFWFPGNYERVQEYPPMIPLFQALLMRIKGVFDFEAAKPIFVFFYFSLLHSVYHAARAFVGSTGTAFWAVAIAALTGAVSLHYATGGYADMPQACLLAAVAAALAAADHDSWGAHHPLPWLLAGLAMVKSEGMLLFGVGSIVITAAWIAGGGFMSLVRPAARGAVIALSGPVVGILLIKLNKSQEIVYGLDWDRAAARLSDVLRLAYAHLLDLPVWGLHWPVVLLAAGLLLLMGPLRERLLAFAGLACLAIYTMTFCFSAWEVKLHVDNAYPRIIGQLVPLTTLIIVAAYHRLAGGFGQGKPDGTANSPVGSERSRESEEPVSAASQPAALNN
jgi:hypothetical protein